MGCERMGLCRKSRAAEEAKTVEGRIAGLHGTIGNSPAIGPARQNRHGLCPRFEPVSIGETKRGR